MAQGERFGVQGPGKGSVGHGPLLSIVVNPHLDMKPNQGRREGEILQFRFQPCPKTTSKVQVGTLAHPPGPAV